MQKICVLYFVICASTTILAQSLSDLHSLIQNEYISSAPSAAILAQRLNGFHSLYQNEDISNAPSTTILSQELNGPQSFFQNEYSSISNEPSRTIISQRFNGPQSFFQNEYSSISNKSSTTILAKGLNGPHSLFQSEYTSLSSEPSTTILAQRLNSPHSLFQKEYNSISNKPSTTILTQGLNGPHSLFQKEYSSISNKSSTTILAQRLNDPHPLFQKENSSISNKPSTTILAKGFNGPHSLFHNEYTSNTPSRTNLKYRYSGNTSSCRFRQWQCFDGSCISSNAVCDGFKDCSDGSDEAQSMCAKRRCPKGSFDCGDSCIDMKLRCDGNKDCTNGYDEHNKTCSRKPNCLSTPYIANGWVGFDYGVRSNTNPFKQESLKFKIRCQTGYSPSSGNLTCINGTWTGTVPTCSKCGEVTPGARRMTPEGDSYQNGITPWHVGVYNKLKKPNKLVCGGSLITAKFVLSAAQCFWDDAIGVLPAPIFAVAAGKVFNAWDDERDYFAQSSDVDDINVPDLFLGETNKLMYNVAFVTLAGSFEFTKYVKPVCIDFGSLFVLKEDKKYKTVGVWRHSSRNRSSQIADVLNVNSCQNSKNYPIGFLNYITKDKKCTTFDGAEIGPEVAGSGLVYSKESFGEKQFYLAGIASMGKESLNWALIFTFILDHESFIEKYYEPI